MRAKVRVPLTRTIFILLRIPNNFHLYFLETTSVGQVQRSESTQAWLLVLLPACSSKICHRHSPRMTSRNISRTPHQSLMQNFSPNDDLDMWATRLMRMRLKRSLISTSRSWAWHGSRLSWPGQLKIWRAAKRKEIDSMVRKIERVWIQKLSRRGKRQDQTRFRIQIQGWE